MPCPAFAGPGTGPPGHCCRRLLENLFPILSTGKVTKPRSPRPEPWKEGSDAQVRNHESIPSRMHFATLLPPASCSTQPSLCNPGEKKRLMLHRSLPGCQKSAWIDKKCADCSVSRRGTGASAGFGAGQRPVWAFFYGALTNWLLRLYRKWRLLKALGLPGCTHDECHGALRGQKEELSP